MQEHVYKKHKLGFLGICFLSAIALVISMRAEDCSKHETYAQKQDKRTKELIDPYITEVNEIIKGVLKKQSQSNIGGFKENVIKTAKNQCSLRKSESTKWAIDVDRSNAGESFKIMIFVSFSMPKESIKGWISQAKKINASVYIRGLVNNSFKDTIQAMNDLAGDQKDRRGYKEQQNQSVGLLIDPTLFKKYSITQVPAVVVVREVEKTEKNGSAVSDIDVKEVVRAKELRIDSVYGDVTLDYALDKIYLFQQGQQGQQEIKNGNHKKGCEKNDFLLDTIKKLRTVDIAKNLNKGGDNV